jgi:hypothetical protein
MNHVKQSQMVHHLNQVLIYLVVKNGQTSMWFLVDQGYFHPDGTDLLDKLALYYVAIKTSAKCYDHKR